VPQSIIFSIFPSRSIYNLKQTIKVTDRSMMSCVDHVTAVYKCGPMAMGAVMEFDLTAWGDISSRIENNVGLFVVMTAVFLNESVHI
jgi:hypothetical protein